VAAAALSVTAGCAGRTERTAAGDVALGAQPTLATVIAAWPASSRTAADRMIAKYGAPDEQTASMLVWHDRGPFRHTIVHRDEVPHAFPKQHLDVLEQVIAYRVPPEMADELAAFNGSLKFDRTKGELSARCDQEAMNILALNLADEVLTRRATVTDARITFALQAEAHAAGRPATLTERLDFKVGTDTRDADTPLSPPTR
jgi:hypothetical protein